jgi:uncharacterized protein YndB with AHSA1/START domain
MYATFTDLDAGPVLRFERRLAHPIDVVFRAVSEPDQLAEWFPSAVEVDLRPGGAMAFQFSEEHGGVRMEGRVVELDPPRRLAFYWGEDLLTFELEPLDERACRLQFSVVLDAREKASRDGAGWHVCLERLRHALDGRAGEPLATGMTADWGVLYEDYQRRGVPCGAEIPTLG